MEYSTFIGIDVSKLKLDFCILQDGELIHLSCKNDVKTINKTFKKLQKEGFSMKNTLVCAEYTGMYVYSLIQASLQSNVNLWLENAQQIKSRSGLQRGKNDKVDAERIALYAHRFQDLACIQKESDKVIEELKYLVSERDLLIGDRTKYLAQIKDQKGHMPEAIYKNKVKRLKSIVKSLEAAIKTIESQLNLLIRSESKLNKQFQLITSVIGVGKQVAIQTIVATRAFMAFKDPRKFACHAGVVPFNYSSALVFIRDGKSPKELTKNLNSYIIWLHSQLYKVMGN